MTDWREKTLEHWGLINRLAARRFASPVLAEEAALAVVDKLRANDWQAVRAYAGRSRFATFLASLTVHLLEDFARARFGRVRPPRWLRALGGVWLDLFRLLCLERMPLAEAVEYLRARHAESEAAIIENTAYAIRQEIVDCGRQTAQETELEESDLALPERETDRCPEQQWRLEEDDRQRLYRLLFATLTGSEESPGDGDWQMVSRLDFALSAEDKLLLAMCYRDGMSGTAVAELLGWSRFQVHGRLRRLLARIRRELERAGLSGELLLLLRS